MTPPTIKTRRAKGGGRKQGTVTTLPGSNFASWLAVQYLVSLFGFSVTQACKRVEDHLKLVGPGRENRKKPDGARSYKTWPSLRQDYYQAVRRLNANPELRAQLELILAGVDQRMDAFLPCDMKREGDNFTSSSFDEEAVVERFGQNHYVVGIVCQIENGALSVNLRRFSW